jgi:Bifunctional DNA primase/polymerase, N-terminal/AAA domain/Primase C terminal 1 (PriCT-1)
MSASPDNRASLDEVLELAKRFPVFPCRPHAEGDYPAKSPRAGHGFDDATNDPDQIRAWWTKHPDSLVGVPTGERTGLAVVDIEPDGQEWYEANREALGETKVHHTRRGRHLIYPRGGRPFPNDIGQLATGVDRRGERGYVIWWLCHGGEVENPELSPPAPEIAYAYGASSQAPVSMEGPIPEGGRNGTLFRMGCKLRGLGASLEFIEAALLVRNERDCKPPLRESEVLKAAEQASKYSTNEQPQGPVLAGPTASLLTLEDLTDEPSEPKVVVDGYLLEDAGCLFAPGGVGKTTLAIFECVHIILGWPLWGLQTIKPGKVLFLTAEDDRQQIARTLNRICRDLNLSSADLEQIRAGFHVEDVSAIQGRLVAADRHGPVRRTELLEELVEQYRGRGISYCHADPLSLLGGQVKSMATTVCPSSCGH